MEKGAIFPLFYLPPIEYFGQLIQHQGPIFIEKQEHFPKQTFRNRAQIHSANGKLNLIVPVIKGSKVHTCVKDVQISYDFDWQRLHWLSLQTAYRKSAYFEFYEDDLAPFYQKRWTYLFDYNQELLQLMLRLLKVNVNYSFTEHYEKAYTELDDFRESIHPKETSAYPIKPYFQVFEDRNGFLHNLSIVDLLFNQGPQSHRYL